MGAARDFCFGLLILDVYKAYISRLEYMMFPGEVCLNHQYVYITESDMKLRWQQNDLQTICLNGSAIESKRLLDTKIEVTTLPGHSVLFQKAIEVGNLAFCGDVAGW